jgi:hypothetical protein
MGTDLEAAGQENRRAREKVEVAGRIPSCFRARPVIGDDWLRMHELRVHPHGAAPRPVPADEVDARRQDPTLR